MTRDDRKEAIEYLVYKIFAREHHKRLANFLVIYGDQLKKSTELSRSLGLNVAYPPIQLDLHEPFQKLVEDIVQIEHKFDAKV